MKLESIDKQTYRKHLNIIIFISIISFAGLSLGISQAAIYFFTDREGTHFWLNVMGVVFGMIIVGSLLNKYKEHPFLAEAYYVWRLKQQINFIYRKQKKIEAAIEDDNVDAMLIMTFYYKACEQLYNLDDNTITISALNKKSNELKEKLEGLRIEINVEDYKQELLQRF